MWLVFARLLGQGSLLKAVRLAQSHACCDVLGLTEGFNEDHLYEALDWLADNQERIDSEIANHAEHWDISRLALVDKNIMRIAICELLYMPDIPSRVSINEAIEMAKKYSTLESSSFVNGILNAIFKSHQTELET